MAGAFLSDIQALRKRAREHIAQGAVTPGYHADREVVLRLLNEALAMEIICTPSTATARSIAYLGDNDSTARRLMEEILAKEEEHADDLANLLEDLNH